PKKARFSSPELEGLPPPELEKHLSLFAVVSDNPIPTAQGDSLGMGWIPELTLLK
ncbi:unnamed protein product, partial [Ilex paraguariensis]